jgi:hypothetical protein
MTSRADSIPRLGLALALALGALLAPACKTGGSESVCKDIPSGGCPLSHTEPCDDPTCAVAYDCNADGTWSIDHVCAPHDAGADALSDAALDAHPLEAAAPHDANIVPPPGAYGGPGCEDLQAPDCTLGLALACPSGCCGCEDLYVCTNGGWNLWGGCSETTGITQAK